MKKKQSTLSNPGTVEEKVATDLPPPDPMELAKLAAIVAPDSEPNAALKTAMKFLAEAIRFSREEWPPSFEELVSRFGSEERWLEVAAKPIKERIQKQWADTFELDATKNTDSVRDFLAERGLRLKTARAVLDNVREAWNARPKNWLTAPFRESADVTIARCKAVVDKKTIYNIPRFLLEDAADHAKRCRRESKLKAWETRENNIAMGVKTRRSEARRRALKTRQKKASV